MANVFSRERAGGKLAWYTKLKDPHTGEWKQELLKSAKTEKQAQKLADELESEHERMSKGLEPGKRFRGTFNELCDWAYEAHFKYLRGWRSELSRIKTHAGPDSYLGRLPADRVTTEEIEKYMAAYAKAPTVRGKPPSADTLNRVRIFFSTVFAKAHEKKKWPDDNPARRVDKRDVVKQSFSILELHEIGPVLEQVTDYWRGCVAVGLIAGLRRGEILALRKSDVLLERRTFIVQRSNEFMGTKGSNKPEGVPFHEALVPYLEPWLATPGELLFPNGRGAQRPRTVHLERVLRVAMVRAGLCDWYDHTCRRCPHVERHLEADPRRCPDCNMKLWPVGHARHVRFHDTRHTFASHALMSGASIQSVQKILRHKDPRLTIETYGHLAIGHLTEEVNRIRFHGLQTSVDRVATVGANADSCEHPPTPSKVPVLGTPNLGAPVVRMASTRGVAEPLRSVQPLKTAAGVIPGRSTPTLGVFRTCANPDAVSGHECSQPFATIHDNEASASTGSPPLSPVLTDVGAPVVRIAGDAHHESRDATPFGPSGDSALLTARVVAERLGVSQDWVYRHIASGQLLHVRAGAHVRVPEHALGAYIERFAGLRVAKPAPSTKQAPAPTRRRGAR